MPKTSMPNVFTRDLEAASAFYRDQLGFSTAYRFPPHGPAEHVVLRLGDSPIGLSTDRALSSIGLAPTTGNRLELVVWCDDVDAGTTRLRAAGAAVVAEPYGHIAGHRRAYLADPDGNWLALVDAPAPIQP